MGVTLTQEGKSLIARLQAEGNALIIDRFLFAHIAGQDDTAPPATNMPENLVHSAAIPAEYRAYVTPSQVVYSALLGSDVGDFSFNWQGLYCSEHDVIVAVATFPALQKRAYDAQTNTPGNNLTRNFILEFSGAQELTGILIEAEVWQIDFTVRLRGIDERERLSNRDIYGRSAFFGSGWLLAKQGSGYVFTPGMGYVEGIRILLEETLPVVPPSYPCDVYLDVSMERDGSDVVAKVSPVAVKSSETRLDYIGADPFKTAHYLEKVAHIASSGAVPTSLRAGVLEDDGLWKIVEGLLKRKITGTAPLTGGGTLSADVSLGLASPLPVANGGTGATTAAAALTALGAAATTDPRLSGSGAFPSEQGVHWALPASGATVTAPADGYFTMSGRGEGVDTVIALTCGLISWALMTPTATGAIFLPVKKGAVVTVEYTCSVSSFKFYYSVGAA